MFYVGSSALYQDTFLETSNEYYSDRGRKKKFLSDLFIFSGSLQARL